MTSLALYLKGLIFSEIWQNSIPQVIFFLNILEEVNEMEIIF